MSEATIVNRFGEKLRTLRLSKGMSLQALASALGYTSHGYLSEIERNMKQPTLELVVKVARLFAVSTDQLLFDEREL